MVNIGGGAEKGDSPFLQPNWVSYYKRLEGLSHRTIEKEVKSPLCQEGRRELKLFHFLEEREMENQGQGRVMVHSYM